MREKVAKAILACIFSIGLINQAFSHRAWDDGTPVEGWIKEACCGVADLHWFTPDQVKQDSRCWYVDPPFPDNGGCIPRDKPECLEVEENGLRFIQMECKEHQTQHGGLYWFFWTDNPKNNPAVIAHPTVYCVFYPMGI